MNSECTAPALSSGEGDFKWGEITFPAPLDRGIRVRREAQNKTHTDTASAWVSS